MTFTDALGREITVESPRRVAAMIGSFADVWCLAGGKDTLVAASNNAWTSLDLGLDEGVIDLGAINEPNLELLFSAEPDLVLASSNTASNLELRESLERAGITVAYFDIQHFEDYLAMLKICTELTGREELYDENGLAVAGRVEAAVARQDGSAPSVVCLRISGTSCKVKGSSGTVLGEILADLGCVNVADRDSTLLDDLSLEAVMAADPDYVFAVFQGSDTGRAQKLLEETLLTDPAWNSLRAVRSGNFYLVEHELYNLKPNARWGEAYEKLADILYTAQ
ncbi:MAG: ABC transporter substrate-binding protein [Oscillospiraceae bacterium]|nr:ABC transporter substrate-binding protein [Oscillospiraceae bacterium]